MFTYESQSQDATQNDSDSGSVPDLDQGVSIGRNDVGDSGCGDDGNDNDKADINEDALGVNLETRHAPNLDLTTTSSVVVVPTATVVTAATPASNGNTSVLTGSPQMATRMSPPLPGTNCGEHTDMGASQGVRSSPGSGTEIVRAMKEPAVTAASGDKGVVVPPAAEPTPAPMPPLSSDPGDLFLNVFGPLRVKKTKVDASDGTPGDDVDARPTSTSGVIPLSPGGGGSGGRKRKKLNTGGRASLEKISAEVNERAVAATTPVTQGVTRTTLKSATEKGRMGAAESHLDNQMAIDPAPNLKEIQKCQICTKARGELVNGVCVQPDVNIALACAGREAGGICEHWCNKEGTIPKNCKNKVQPSAVEQPQHQGDDVEIESGDLGPGSQKHVSAALAVPVSSLSASSSTGKCIIPPSSLSAEVTIPQTLAHLPRKETSRDQSHDRDDSRKVLTSSKQIQEQVRATVRSIGPTSTSLTQTAPSTSAAAGPTEMTFNDINMPLSSLVLRLLQDEPAVSFLFFPFFIFSSFDIVISYRLYSNSHLISFSSIFFLSNANSSTPQVPLLPPSSNGIFSTLFALSSMCLCLSRPTCHVCFLPPAIM